MAKKATGKKPSTEILDDNGTLIAASDRLGATTGGGNGEKSTKRPSSPRRSVG
jgi:hypothetical protein